MNNFTATARASDVMVRTWRPERDRRVLLVIDTARTSVIVVALEVHRLEGGGGGDGRESKDVAAQRP